MIDNNYTVLGVMSGTSLDGIDLAIAQYSLSYDCKWSYRLIKATTMPYSAAWKKRLAKGYTLGTDGLKQLDVSYTAYLGSVIRDYIETHRVLKLDLVCSHGHTILHQPERGLTLQIGNLPALRALVGMPVVCDFRVADVALGGQGAPLVPIGDRLLFSNYESCLNLGGFANCSFEQNNFRVAFDICPVNIVLNPLAERLGFEFDKGGVLARQGTIVPELLSRLNALAFYEKRAPKSLGLEWVVEQIQPLLTEFENHDTEDLLCTLVEHMAIQLAAQLPEGLCLVTGGGTYNQFLLERLRTYAKTKIEVPDSLLIDNKEALVFGLLGVLRWRDEVNCLSSVTGASKDHSSGVVFR